LRSWLAFIGLAAVIGVAAIFVSAMARAHHSYAMFDGSGTRTVVGTVARLEWKNPHVFLWVYVPKSAAPGEHDLWAFENGSPTGLSARGWTRQSFKPGERVTVEFWPLRNGAKGGHFAEATLADGRKLVGAGGLGR
jgi:hypothetical protein